MEFEANCKFSLATSCKWDNGLEVLEDPNLMYTVETGAAGFVSNFIDVSCSNRDDSL